MNLKISLDHENGFKIPTISGATPFDFSEFKIYPADLFENSRSASLYLYAFFFFVHVLLIFFVSRVSSSQVVLWLSIYAWVMEANKVVMKEIGKFPVLLRLLPGKSKWWGRH